MRAHPGLTQPLGCTHWARLGVLMACPHVLSPQLWLEKLQDTSDPDKRQMLERVVQAVTVAAEPLDAALQAGTANDTHHYAQVCGPRANLARVSRTWGQPSLDILLFICLFDCLFNFGF